jgi:predicted TIM-barrel fold metal-dependent hydrolase
VTDQNLEAPLVDTHFHVWTTDMPIVGAAWHKGVQPATIEQALKVLDDHGVVFGVIAAPSLHATYFDYMRVAVKKHKRLRSTAVIDPRTDIYQLEQMKNDGFVGIRFVWHHLDQAPDLDTDEYRQMLKRVADLDWHVEIIEREQRMPALLAALEKNGIQKIVIDHMTRMDDPKGIKGDCFKAVAAAVDRGRTWVKLSAGYRFKSAANAAAMAGELVRLTGGERLVWGSDWPFAGFEGKVQYRDTINSLKEWVPDERIRRKIGGETALKLFFT